MVMPRLLSEVVEGLRNRPEVEAVLLSGSRGRGKTPDSFADWDLYVYLTEPLPLDVRKGILAPRSTLLDLNGDFGEPEDCGELNDGTPFELIYRDLDQFAAQVAGVVINCEVSVGESTGAWDNLLSSHILFDRGRAQELQKRFQVPYPAALQKAVVAKNWPLMNAGAANYRNQVAKAVKRNDAVAVQGYTASFLACAFDLVFSANGRTHPGKNRLSMHASQLPLLPSDWSGLLASIDRSGGGNRVGLTEALDRLAQAMEIFLVRQGLLEAPKVRVRTQESASAAPPGAAVPTVENRLLTVYTDGGCIGNPGKGAWAFLVEDGVMRVEDTGGDPLTTNNKMELQAVISALSAIAASKEWAGRPIRIHTDSQYVRNGITTWIKTWASNGWKTAAKEPVKNQDLWMELQQWDRALKPEWKWVKGHAGNPNNERCDALVRRTMDQM